MYLQGGYNMQSIISVLRDVLGEADFYTIINGNSRTWDYGSMIEYFVGSLILLICVSSVFKIISKLIK